MNNLDKVIELLEKDTISITQAEFDRMDDAGGIKIIKKDGQFITAKIIDGPLEGRITQTFHITDSKDKVKTIIRRKEKLKEGRSKHALEDKLERMCTCDGGISIDSSEHDKKCPCYKYLKGLGY